ncbi:MAG TPA: hypothetical protein VMI56_08390 [Reyranella sp.]|nr:hypothetical protein [Reyranella sp.]
MSATKVFVCTSLIFLAIAAQPVFAQGTGNNSPTTTPSSPVDGTNSQRPHAHKHHHHRQQNPGSGGPTTQGSTTGWH